MINNDPSSIRLGFEASKRAMLPVAVALGMLATSSAINPEQAQAHGGVNHGTAVAHGANQSALPSIGQNDINNNLLLDSKVSEDTQSVTTGNQKLSFSYGSVEPNMKVTEELIRSFLPIARKEAPNSRCMDENEKHLKIIIEPPEKMVYKYPGSEESRVVLGTATSTPTVPCTLRFLDAMPDPYTACAATVHEYMHPGYKPKIPNGIDTDHEIQGSEHIMVGGGLWQKLQSCLEITGPSLYTQRINAIKQSIDQGIADEAARQSAIEAEIKLQQEKEAAENRRLILEMDSVRRSDRAIAELAAERYPRIAKALAITETSSGDTLECMPYPNTNTKKAQLCITYPEGANSVLAGRNGIKVRVHKNYLEEGLPKTSIRVVPQLRLKKMLNAIARKDTAIKKPVSTSRVSKFSPPKASSSTR